MSSDGGPWGRAEPEAPAPRKAVAAALRARPLLLWLLFLAGLGGLVFALAKAFPEARTRDQWGDVAYLSLFLVLLSAGAYRLRRAALVQSIGHLAIWMVLAAGVALGYAYREELAGVPQHLALAFGTGRPVQVGDHELVVPQDESGAFTVVGKVNGERVLFMIDTGSTETVLSPADARRLGIDTAVLKYADEVETANGKGYGAPVKADRLEVGPIALSGFPMAVNKAPMRSSLLGLSFLNRLDSFEIKGRKLYLKWGDRPAPG
jgi:aspartyl protease family protein